MIEELRKRVGLSEEQARRSVEVFEAFLAREREPGGEPDKFRGLFTGSVELYEERE